MPKIPQVGVIGCGYWGKNLVRNFRDLAALACICDASSEGRQAAQQIAPGVRVTGDFQSVLDDSAIDAVVIATPAVTHRDLAIAALQAGKDTFVEKPLALTPGEGAAIQLVADRQQRLLMVGHLLEYHPAVVRLRRLVTEGTLGRLLYLYSNRLNFGKIRTEENALWSFAPHDLSVLMRLVGESPEEVTCVGGSYVTPQLADVTVSNLVFPCGVRAHVFVSWLNPFKEQKLVVVGEQKMAVFNDVLPDRKLVIYNQMVQMRDRVPQLHRGDETVLPLPDDEPLRAECEHFLDCVQSRSEPLTSGASGIQVLRVLQACQLSMDRRGEPVRLDEITC